jgi:hypothetical protein
MSIGSMQGIRRNFAFNASSSAINSAQRASSQSAISASSCAIVSGRGRRNAIRRAIASCTVRFTEMFAGRAGGRVAGPAKPLAFGFSELPFGEAWQFEIVEEQVDKFIAAQNEPECILAVAFTRIGGLSSAALTRTRKHVTFERFVVSGKHHVARAALAAKARLIHPVEWDADSPPSTTSLMSRSCDDFLTAP